MDSQPLGPPTLFVTLKQSTMRFCVHMQSNDATEHTVIAPVALHQPQHVQNVSEGLLAK